MRRWSHRCLPHVVRRHRHPLYYLHQLLFLCLVPTRHRLATQNHRIRASPSRKVAKSRSPCCSNRRIPPAISLQADIRNHQVRWKVVAGDFLGREDLISSLFGRFVLLPSLFGLLFLFTTLIPFFPLLFIVLLMFTIVFGIATMSTIRPGASHIP